MYQSHFPYSYYFSLSSQYLINLTWQRIPFHGYLSILPPNALSRWARGCHDPSITSWVLIACWVASDLAPKSLWGPLLDKLLQVGFSGRRCWDDFDAQCTFLEMNTCGRKRVERSKVGQRDRTVKQALKASTYPTGRSGAYVAHRSCPTFGYNGQIFILRLPQLLGLRSPGKSMYLSEEAFCSSIDSGGWELGQLLP